MNKININLEESLETLSNKLFKITNSKMSAKRKKML